MSSTTLIQHQNEKTNTLLFHQVNVGKGGSNMDTALQKAVDTEVHVVMIQEPLTMRKNGDFITKSHIGLLQLHTLRKYGTEIMPTRHYLREKITPSDSNQSLVI